MVEKFGIDEALIQAGDEFDRFKRPVVVAIFGTLISLAIVAAIFLRSGANDNAVPGIVAFGVLAVAMSCTYAFLGARYSRSLANRVLGIVGGVIAAAGVGFVFWMLLTKMP
jgi:hypothetical protein